MTSFTTCHSIQTYPTKNVTLTFYFTKNTVPLIIVHMPLPILTFLPDSIDVTVNEGRICSHTPWGLGSILWNPRKYLFYFYARSSLTWLSTYPLPLITHVVCGQNVSIFGQIAVSHDSIFVVRLYQIIILFH